ncbi:MAG: hypothetical protein JRJ24_17415 [Deltaproteobacteria bacterium]|nr:hypothetical protein [Deltaproteobacteria bacterium]
MKRVQLLIREKITVASFAQAPGERVIKTLKDAGVTPRRCRPGASTP